jgi:malate dehydrogenase (oxaloacetate-decarboxylating)(NADP+)
MDEQFRRSALEYHRLPSPGKISVAPTKGLVTQRDLALAYTPGVAAACEAIVEDPAQASELTARANLVAVITNGSAVLGLGNIGPLAGKPVMEGKACLFKKFAGIDVFDLEIHENYPVKLVDTIASLEPTFGGINLEDIRSPDCFVVEQKLRERMRIPVFHDDQHGTAIIVGAAILNGLRVVGKDIRDVTLVCVGAGAAALACLDMLVTLGLSKERIVVADNFGVVYAGRPEGMDPYKARYAHTTGARTLADVIDGADIFLGLSAGRVVAPALIGRMAPRPLVFALANPEPEILPELVRQARPDAVIATGRSDYPNQVNNVLCFPFIFRGALDAGATTINEPMKLAALHALAELAQHAEHSDALAAAYGDEPPRFGPDYLIPRPFDPRLITRIAPAVAQAAMDSGVATRPIADFAQYRERLASFVYRSGTIMQPVYAAAKQAQPRVIYCEGEDERVLRAVQVVVDERLAKPILIGRPDVVQRRLERYCLTMRAGIDFELVNPESDPRYRECWELYYELTKRKGASVEYARTEMRRNTTIIGATLMRRGEADAMLCGTYGHYHAHLKDVDDIIGLRPGVNDYAALNVLILPRHTVFIADTQVNDDPSAAQIAQMTLLAAEEVRRFGVVPRVALLSHSSFGSSDAPSARKMRDALALIRTLAPTLEVEGEMQGDAALSKPVLDRALGGARLSAEANLLIMPTLDAANISFSLLKSASGSDITVGPILLGTARPVHVLDPTVSVRRIINMTAVAAVGVAATRGAGGAQ